MQNVLDTLGMDEPQFRPEPYYSHSGDCLIWFVEEACYDRDRINSILTVFRHRETRSVIGIQVKDVGTILEQISHFGFSYKEEGVEFRVLLLGAKACDTEGEIESLEPVQEFLERVGGDRKIDSSTLNEACAI